MARSSIRLLSALMFGVAPSLPLAASDALQFQVTTSGGVGGDRRDDEDAGNAPVTSEAALTNGDGSGFSARATASPSLFIVEARAAGNGFANADADWDGLILETPLRDGTGRLSVTFRLTGTQRIAGPIRHASAELEFRFDTNAFANPPLRVEFATRLAENGEATINETFTFTDVEFSFFNRDGTRPVSLESQMKAIADLAPLGDAVPSAEVTGRLEIINLTVEFLPDDEPPPEDGHHWINAAGGSFSAEANWNPEEVPGSGDTAIFDLPGSYGVNVGTHTVDRLLVGGEPSLHVTFTNANLTATTTSLEEPGIVINHGNFSFNDGNLTSVHATLGSSAATAISLTQAQWDVSGRLTIGHGGEAVLTVNNGQIAAGESYIGHATNGAFGRATITGDEALWNAGPLAVGLAGPGTLNIAAGASVEADAVSLGGSATGEGTIQVEGVAGATPSTLSTRSLVVGGLTILDYDIDGGIGTLQIIDGGLVQTTAGGAIIGFTGEGHTTVSGIDATSGTSSLLSIAPGTALLVGGRKFGTLAINSGGSVQASELQIGNEARGEVFVDGRFNGIPSTLNAGPFLVVGQGAEGLLTVSQGGNATAEIVRIGDTSDAAGHVVVQGEAPDGTASTLLASFRLDVGGEAFTTGLGAGELDVLAGGAVNAFGVLVGNGGPATVTIDGAAVGSGAPSSLTGEVVAIGPDSPATVSASNGGRLAANEAVVLHAGSEIHTETGAITIGEIEPLVGSLRIGPGGTLQGGGVVFGFIENLGGVFDLTFGNVEIGTSGIPPADGPPMAAARAQPTIRRSPSMAANLAEPPATLTIIGDYTQSPTGVLHVTIGGLEEGFDHSLLAVTGTATFAPDTSIRITLTDPNPDDTIDEVFMPRTGDDFSFLVADDVVLPPGTTLNDLVEFTNLPADVEMDLRLDVVDGETVVIAETTASPAPPPGPRITSHPKNVTATAGAPLELNVGVAGASNTTYQWRFDGSDIAGATTPTLELPSAQSFHAGDYSVVVTADGASVESRIATVAVDAAPTNHARLLNLSTRAQAHTGDDILIPGFVVSGTGTKRLLIRAVGPTLENFPYNIASALENPRMTLKRQDFSVNPPVYVDIHANDNWATNANATAITQAIADLSAFPFEDDREAALLVDLAPGQYSVFADGVADATGIAIVELYDADGASPTATLINLSNRGFVGTGAQVMIPGFVISSEGPKTLLIRVVGPTLAGAPYNVPGTMVDPKLEIFPAGSNTPILANDNWGDNPDVATTASVAQTVGAFALANGSADAAFVVTLPPGTYTVVGSSAIANGTGVVLVEVYVVP